MRGLLTTGCLALALALSATQAVAETIFGLNAANQIITFDSATPGVVLTAGAISGLATGTVLTGLDLRPANRMLYSVGSDSNLYLIAKDGSGTGYTATTVGNIANPITGPGVGLNFNPVPDRLRLVTSTEQNYRINPDTAVTIKDGTITGPSGTPDLVGVAYTNSRPGATSTMLYALDAATDMLFRSTDPNAGIYVNTNLAGTAFGSLGVDLGVNDAVGFDISGGSGAAYFNRNNQFYSLNLTTGAASLVGTLGAGSLIGIAAAAVPEPATWALMITGFGLVGAAARRRRPATLALA